LHQTEIKIKKIIEMVLKDLKNTFTNH
jgi:hypothetical protein